MSSEQPKPLSGIRVLDLGRFIAAPYCGMLLADLGAEVIRVERPGGEEDRRIGLKAANGENMMFQAVGRNKKAITLDFSKPQGQSVLHDLIHESDVFLHNFSVGAAAAFGFDYEQARRIRPGIIYVGISCYGAEGPSAKRTGFDQLAQIQSGAAALTGFEESPMRAGVPWVDFSTGLSAALGVLAALRHRDTTGEGQSVDCALLRTAVSFTTPMIAEATVLGRERPRLGNRLPYVGPTDLYKCKDGYLYVATTTEGMWRALMRLIGKAEWIDVPEFAVDEQRFQHRERIDPAVKEWMAARTVQEATDAMDKARIPCGRYQTTAQVPDDPQVQACGMLPYVDVGADELSRVPVCGFPAKLSVTALPTAARAPRVGEHNAEIYRSVLHYDEAKYLALQVGKII